MLSVTGSTLRIDALGSLKESVWEDALFMSVPLIRAKELLTSCSGVYCAKGDGSMALT